MSDDRYELPWISVMSDVKKSGSVTLGVIHYLYVVSDSWSLQLQPFFDISDFVHIRVC